mmetsp:Transcript_68504/g.132271  ORF Transcript_68504/g.132271 Transcript_68504/m.132271 type:complete len:640 (+) Transcript_68504:72-1991(+)
MLSRSRKILLFCLVAVTQVINAASFAARFSALGGTNAEMRLQVDGRDGVEAVERLGNNSSVVSMAVNSAAAHIDCNNLNGTNLWLTFGCRTSTQASPRNTVMFMLLKSSLRVPTPTPGPWDHVVGISIFFGGIFFAIFSCMDVHKFIALGRQRQQASQADSATIEKKAVGGDYTASNPDAEGKWSIWGIVALTAYRFYTGFLSATWLPYLLAMEGQYLWPDMQSIFMGLAKLIYGVTILMNPIFGLIGDQATALSHGIGRRLFVRVGICLSALGMYICILAGRDHAFLSFLAGILIWRLGEALNDVTTEALVPEMVPQSQFQTASAVKSASFLLGGLFGYVLLIVFADVDYSWLYFAYPIGMLLASVPPLFLLDQDRPLNWCDNNKPSNGNFLASLLQAYTNPMQIPGGFPLACLSVFVFSLGTAPMFFLLLVVRDLLGVSNLVAMQEVFSADSIVFFVSAAMAAVISAKVSGGRTNSGFEILTFRARMLILAMAVFGVVIFFIPAMALFPNNGLQTSVFFCMTVLFGGSFGMAFTMFQELTWQLLPEGVEVANAMGFNVMSRLLGVGLGNFVSGMLLDLSYTGGAAGGAVYDPMGYLVMCTLSGIAVALSCYVAHRCYEAHKSLVISAPTGTAIPPAA